MTETTKTIVVDAEGLILGRMASQVAKALRQGNTVRIVNCEKAVMSGKKESILAERFTKGNYGHSLTGPYVSRRADFYVRRTIRGMLPRRKASGRDDFRRLRCFVGMPEEFKEAKPITFDNAKATRLRSTGYVTVAQICRHLGGKV